LYPGSVQGECSHGKTKPEERGGGDLACRPVLLVASYGGRRQIDVPETGVLVIGRAPGGEGGATAAEAAGLIGDELLSRQHLRIARQAGGYVVEDLGSRNGTYLDGRRVSSPARLAEGSALLFGNQIALFRRISEAARVALAREAEAPFGPLPTFSPALALAFARLRKLAPTDAELLLVGEAGVGREVYARAVHQASGRRGPFVALKCGSVPPSLIESELFGGDASQGRSSVTQRGLVGAAEGGTLLLDEIEVLPVDLQTKIFRQLRHIRLIAATTRIDATRGAAGMREDLLARLGADPVEIPPLRARPEDVPALLEHFAAGAVEKVEPAALRALCLYSWPLNVRELRKVTGTALTLAGGRELRLDHLPAGIQAALERGPLVAVRRRSPRAAPERAELEQLLRDHDGNVADVARAMDRQWNVVWRWVVRLGLSPQKFRKDGGDGG